MRSNLNHIHIFRLGGAVNLLVLLLTVVTVAIDIDLRRSMGEMLDMLSAGQLWDAGWLRTGSMILAFLPLKYLLLYTRNLSTNRLQARLYHRLEKKALSACQAGLDGIDPGTAGTYFTSDVSGVVRYVDRVLRVGLPDMMTWLLSVALLFAMEPWLGAAAVLSSVLPVLSMTCMSRVLVQDNGKYQEIM